MQRECCKGNVIMNLFAFIDIIKLKVVIAVHVLTVKILDLKILTRIFKVYMTDFFYLLD